MGEEQQITPRHQPLARRKAAGYSQERMAEFLEVTPASYRRWERGRNTPRDRYKAPLAEVLNLTLDELALLLENQLEERPWPDITGHKVPFWLNLYASFEHSAARIDTVEPLVIPGLLQTRAYASAIMRSSFENWTSREAEDLVGYRLARQRVLNRTPNPLRYRCIIDEATLHRMAESVDVMRAQLDHLADLAARTNIEVRVMPARSLALSSNSAGAFSLFYPDGTERPYVVSSEDATGSQHRDSPDVIGRHVRLVEFLLGKALSREESVRAILRARGALA